MKNYEIGRLAEGLPRGAAEPLSFEDDSQFQIDAFSFEDDSPFRPSEDAFCQTGQNGSPEGR